MFVSMSYNKKGTSTFDWDETVRPGLGNRQMIVAQVREGINGKSSHKDLNSGNLMVLERKCRR